MIYETVLKQALQCETVKIYKVHVEGNTATAQCGDEEPIIINMPNFSEEELLEYYEITTELRKGLYILIDEEDLVTPHYYLEDMEITYEQYMELSCVPR